MAGKRYVRKQVKRLKKNLRNRYTNKQGTPRIKKMMKDIMKLKTIVNVEKKFFNLPTISSSVGQVFVNATGAIIQDVTPTPAQGLGANQISGHSFKLTGMYIEVQLKQQSGLTTEATYIFELWDVKGTPESTSIIFGDIFNTSTFSGVIDSYSTRNQDHFADYSCIKKWTMKFKNDATYNSSASTNQVLTKQIPMKIEKHIRINASQVIQNGQMVLTVRANYGNHGNTDSTLSNIGTQTNRTGADLLYTTKYWFVDN